MINDHGTSLICAVAGLTVLLFALTFQISPLNGEDYGLTRDMDSLDFTARLDWILNASSTQIQQWNARLGEQLAIFWLGMPKLYFTIFATTVFVVVNIMLAALEPGIAETKIKTAISITIFYALWPGMEVLFWSTVNAGYMQPMAITLGCMMFYRSPYSIGLLASSNIRVMIASALGLLAGLSFENTPVALIFFMAASLLLSGRSALNWRTALPIVATSAGWLALVNAPSTANRVNFYKDASGFSGWSFDHLADRIESVLTVFTTTSLPLLITAVIATAYLLITSPHRKRIALIFAMATMIVLSVIAAPYTEPRSFTVAWALLFSLSVAGIAALIRRIGMLKPVLSALAVALLYFPLKTHFIYDDFAKKQNGRDAQIRNEITSEHCQTGIRIKPVVAIYPYKYLNNREEWYVGNMGFIGRYYGCKIEVD